MRTQVALIDAAARTRAGPERDRYPVSVPLRFFSRGGGCISSPAHDQIRGKVSVPAA